MNEQSATNGYARIREVYELLRASEDRLSKVFGEQLEAMERRLFDRLAEMDANQRSAWGDHEERHTKADSERQEILSAFSSDRIRSTVRQERTYYIRTLVGAVEDHWRLLTILLFAAGLLLDFDINLP